MHRVLASGDKACARIILSPKRTEPMSKPIRVAPEHRVSQTNRILCFPPRQSLVVLCTPMQHPPYLLHQSPCGSIACTGEGCILCPSPARCYGYYPVAVFRVENGVIRQEPAILPVTQSCIPAFQRFRRGNLISVARRGNMPNGQMTIVLEKTDVTALVEEFDPLTQLMTLWELRRNSLAVAVASRRA